jgi:serine protease inhibitor
MKTPNHTLTVALTIAMHGLSPAAEKASSAVQANTEFGLELYSQLAKENEGKNLFFSPYSVSSALAMTTEDRSQGCPRREEMESLARPQCQAEQVRR